VGRASKTPYFQLDFDGAALESASLDFAHRARLAVPFSNIIQRDRRLANAQPNNAHKYCGWHQVEFLMSDPPSGMKEYLKAITAKTIPHINDSGFSADDCDHVDSILLMLGSLNSAIDSLRADPGSLDSSAKI
jgi:hypothetical protein